MELASNELDVVVEVVPFIEVVDRRGRSARRRKNQAVIGVQRPSGVEDESLCASGAAHPETENIKSRALMDNVGRSVRLGDPGSRRQPIASSFGIGIAEESNVRSEEHTSE